MNILLTGGTGFIGSAILEQLVAGGHTVTALVRSDASAEKVAAQGATPVLGDLTDLGWLTEQLRQVDGAIHAAAAGNPEQDEAADRVVAQAVIAAFSGTDKPYVHTSGIWIWGNGDDLDEESPLDPPAQTAWRLPIERLILEADIAATVLAPGIVYGRGDGIPALITSGPRGASGAMSVIGTGEQHWTTVHVDDIASLYVAVLEQGSALGYLIGVNGKNPTVSELAETAAGDAAVVAEGVRASRARLGEKFADALMLDQQAAGERARSLGWEPTGPDLLEEFRTGGYAG